MPRELPEEFDYLSNATKIVYQSFLNILDETLPDWDNLSAEELADTIVNSSDIRNKAGTFKFVSAWFRAVKGASIDERKPFINKINEFQNRYIARVGSNVNHDNLPSYEQALEIVRQTNDDEFKIFCLLYMLIPAQRPQDYYRLRVFRDDEEPNGYQGNYIYRGKLYLNQFKTDRCFDAKIYDIPDEILKLIPKDTTYLFNNNSLDAYRRYFNERLKRRFNRKMTIRRFRNIYASREVNSLNDIKARAESMNHSVETHLLYRRHIQPETIAEVQDLPTDDSKPSPPKLKVRKRAKIKAKPKLATLAPSEAHEETETDTNSPELPVPEIEEDNIEDPYHDVDMDETGSESFGCLELIKRWCPFLF